MATFVLIPGAGGDPWEWHLLAPELEALGHDVVAVRLPSGDDGAGWSEYADAVIEATGDRRDVVLVAQSLAGFSASLVPERRPVDLLVLLNAMIPLPGETGNDWWSNTRRKEAEQAYYAAVGLPPETASDDLAVYFHDVPADGRRGGRRLRAPAVDDADGAALAARAAGRTSRRVSWPDATTACSRSCFSSGSRRSGWGSRPTRSTAGTWWRSASRRSWRGASRPIARTSRTAS